MKPIQVGLIGLGTVGCATLNVLQRNFSDIIRRTGRSFNITHAAVKDLNKPRACSLDGIALTVDPMSLATHDDIDIIVELMGGEEIARDVILTAINHGKHVITANKALIAKQGNDIFSAAHGKGVMVAFEAAVAGGIPIIKAIREGLSGNRIHSIAGIINGTSNFILTAMSKQGLSFETALKCAQESGYAETDPSLDINGTDIAHKLTILASVAFGVPLQFDQVYREGIDNLEPEDITAARDLGFTIKQLGFTRLTEQGIEMRVHPTLIPRDVTLAHVNGVMNAVEVLADALGPSLYYGAGAGGEATASAVVADVVDVIRTLTTDPTNRVPHLAFQPDSLKHIDIVPIEDIQSAYFLHMSVQDKPGVLADIANIFSKLDISIQSLIQRDASNAQTSDMVPIVMITHQVKEKNMNAALHKLNTMPMIEDTVKRIRLEQLS